MDDDAIDGGVGVGLEDFLFEVGWGLGKIILYGDADVGAVFDFEVDVFGDDGVIGIAKDEEFGCGREGFDLMGLALLDKTGEFGTVKRFHGESPLALVRANNRICRKLCR